MKNKIRRRLFSYFTITLVLFSVIIGILFTSLFSKYNRTLQIDDMEIRAKLVAENISGNSLGTSSSHGKGHMRQNSSMNMRYIEGIAMSDMWIVDPETKQIIRGQGHHGITYGELPDGTEEIVESALSGKTEYTESFSPLLENPSITVATPVILDDGTIGGAVLLHKELEDITSATQNGLYLLFGSMVIGVLLSFGVAIVLASRFTKPINKMIWTAGKISDGNFDVKNDIVQDDEIGELAYAMDDMAGKLHKMYIEQEREEELRREFLSNVSHELRTPVTVMRGSLEALHDGVVSEPGLVREYHEQMLLESKYLERLVNDLLELSRLESPNFKMEMDNINVSEIANDAIRSMNRLAENKDIVIELKRLGDDFTIFGDYGRIRQMLIIVLENAIKFSYENSIIEMELRDEKSNIEIIVKDNGQGISEDNLNSIFDRFHRQTDEYNKTGSGLGLAIAKQIADRHNGEIYLESNLGVGTKVHMIFRKA
ncbi:MAG: HAMP domain-containing histidine kinase [Tissierellia bacterium]|nr:HAMP domain-containing histidine kinase [Tissierellia bacterium]